MFEKGNKGKLGRITAIYLIISTKYAFRIGDLIAFDREKVREELRITERQERNYLRYLEKEGYLKCIPRKVEGRIHVPYAYTEKSLSFFREIRDALTKVVEEVDA